MAPFGTLNALQIVLTIDSLRRLSLLLKEQMI